MEDINKKIIGKEQGMITLSELIAEKVQVRDKKISDKEKVDRKTDAECFSNLSKEIGNMRDEISAFESRNRKLRSDRERLIAKLDEILELAPRNTERQGS